jgi:hypothetical protein
MAWQAGWGGDVTRKKKAQSLPQQRQEINV